MRKFFLAIAMIWAGALGADPSFWQHEWPKTDFSKTTIGNWTEIMSGGPGKDGIPALDTLKMRSVRDAGEIGALEGVITLAMAGQPARAYPLRYLMWHEIANDEVGGVPVAVTYCPLCNSGIVFDRRVEGKTLSFGVTGKLRNSDMVMYDRETQSWWQQATGEGIVGAMTGAELASLPAWMESFESFKAAHPEGLVMAEPDFPRAYGRNPYVRYDTSHRPFLYSGEMPPHGIAPLVRVVRVGSRAWPLPRLASEGEIKEAEVVLSWVKGQASALDGATVAAGRDVGNVRVRDASDNDLPHDVMFAFAFHAFWPDGTWMLAP